MNDPKNRRIAAAFRKLGDACTEIADELEPPRGRRKRLVVEESHETVIDAPDTDEQLARIYLHLALTKYSSRRPARA